MKTQTGSAHLWESTLPGVELFAANYLHKRFSEHFHVTGTIGLNEEGRGCCPHCGENRILDPGSARLRDMRIYAHKK